TRKLPGEFVGEIQVFSNDPDQLITKLLIKANIVTKISGNASTVTPAWKNIAPQEAQTMLKNPQTILVDVRTPAEYKKGHIPNCLLIPLDRLTAEAVLQLTDKNALIIVYCQSGIRSQKAAQTLAQLGYTHVYDLGGIRDWPYKIEK
ncbi:MAG TPA: rhodanese-like domain-containing protein, partial [Bacillota bacterium]|nr:rhodanese-like domain-containing protein [Bacillota bacterium]